MSLLRKSVNFDLLKVLLLAYSERSHFPEISFCSVHQLELFQAVVLPQIFVGYQSSLQVGHRLLALAFLHTGSNNFS